MNIKTRKNWFAGLTATALVVGGLTGFVLNRAHGADADTVVATGGAPYHILVDNASLRVTFISYPAGFHRSGAGLKRPYDTLIVYLDPGAFKSLTQAGAGKQSKKGSANPGNRRVGEPAACPAVGDCGPVGPDGNYESQTASGQPLAVGTVTWHPKGSGVPTVEDTQAFRILYIELKR